MSPDVLAQLRIYATQLDTRAPSLKQLMPRTTTALPPTQMPPRRRWVAAIAAGAAVLALIGLVAVGMLLWGGEEPPVVTDPTTTTLGVRPPALSDAGTNWTRLTDSEAALGAAVQAIQHVAFAGSGYVAIGLADDQMALWISSDGADWTSVPVDPTVFGDTGVADLIAGGPGFVAVGTDDAGTAIWTSPDGLAWIRAAADPLLFGGASGHTLATSGTQVIIGGARDGRAAVWSSMGGVAWEQATVNDSQGGNIRAITAGGPGFVAVGQMSGGNGAVWSSSDGLTWTRVVADPEIFLNVSIGSVASTGASLVAFGEDYSFAEDGHPLLLTSEDGLTWNRSDLGPDLFERTQVWDLIATGPGYVAVGDRDRRAAMWTSEDGLAWEMAELDPAQNDRAGAYSITAGRDRLIAVGAQALTPQREVGAIWVSPNVAADEPTPQTTTTTSTTAAPVATELTWRRIDFDPEEIPDGRLYDVTSGESGLTALGFRREPDGTVSRLVMVSADGSSWDTTAVLDQPPRLASIVEGGPGWVAAGRVEADNCYGSDAAFSYSEDGVTWTLVSHDPETFGDAEVFNVIAGGPGLVAIGETCLDTPVVQSTDEGTVVWTSPDGISWTRAAEPTGLDEAYWLESVGTRLVAFGWEPIDEERNFVTVFVSEDGVGWTQVLREEPPDEFNDYTVAGRRGLELIRVQGARGSGTMTVWSSHDGVTWTRGSADIAEVGRLRAVAGVGAWWVAAGLTIDDVPAVWISQDGLQWTRVPDDGSIFGSGGGIVDLVEHGSDLVAVGMVIDDAGERPAAWIASP